MTVEELKKHCEKQINLCSRLNDYKHLEEHRLILNLIEENKQLKDNWNKLKEYVGIEWYSYDNDSIEFEVAKDILNKMQKLESENRNE